MGGQSIKHLVRIAAYATGLVVRQLRALLFVQDMFHNMGRHNTGQRWSNNSAAVHTTAFLTN
jgi:hypothetical protein